MSERRLVVVDDADALADRAAGLIARAPRDGDARVCLSGGSTPRASYELLAGLDVPWDRLHLFFGDERCVPPDDEGSNYGMVRDALLDRVAIPAANVHRIPGELPPADAARAADDDVRAAFGDAPVPRFDLMFLGIGDDGHTASLFPGTGDDDVTDRVYIPVHRPGMPQPWRVSVTMPVINATWHAVFLVGGAAKGPVLRRAWERDTRVPAGQVSPRGDVTFLVDRDAARAAGLER